MTSPPGSVLFDKGVVRRIYERRVRLALGEPPTLLQVESANAYARVAALTNRLYITEQTANILRLRTPVFAAPLLADLTPLKKARYLRRWARRLRRYGLSLEDAIVVAYGSFGVAAGATRAGVEMIVTADLKLAARYHDTYADIESRFNEMIRALPDDYSELALPQILTTSDVLKLL